MRQTLSSLLSRKFIVTILTVLALALGGDTADGLDPTKITTILGAAIASIYVIIQGLVDRAKEKAKATTATLSPDSQQTITQLVGVLTEAIRTAAQPPATPVPKPNEPTTPTGAKAIGVVGLALCLGACGAAQTNERPACLEAALAKLEAQYVSEVLSACGATPVSQCSQAEAIEDAHQKRLEQWAQCQ